MSSRIQKEEIQALEEGRARLCPKCGEVIPLDEEDD